MSTRYESVHNALLYPDAFRVAAPALTVGREVWPRQPGVFIRAAQIKETRETEEAVDPAEAADADKSPRELPTRELVAGQFGLVPRWVKSASDARLRSTKLVNARSETVTTSNNFHDAWLAGQRCIVPMRAFMEDDWRSGKAVPTRIARVDGEPMGVAGLWESWTGQRAKSSSATPCSR